MAILKIFIKQYIPYYRRHKLNINLEPKYKNECVSSLDHTKRHNRYSQQKHFQHRSTIGRPNSRSQPQRDDNDDDDDDDKNNDDDDDDDDNDDNDSDHD